MPVILLFQLDCQKKCNSKKHLTFAFYLKKVESNIHAVVAEVHEVHVFEVGHVVVGALLMVVVIPAVYDMIFWEFS